MPMADEFDDHGRFVRAFAYGKDKTKKTWWACRAAEAGYNVVLLDGDDGASIVKQLPMEARKRILVVNCVNTRERAVFALFMASFLRPGKPFLWDEQAKISIPVSSKRDPSHSYILFDPTKFTANDLVIPDSWTALSASSLLQFAHEQQMDLIAVERDGDQFAHLNFQSRFLDYCLNNLHALPCHVIVIGHEQNWEQYKGKGRERKLVAEYRQPISSSGPHGQKIGKHFDNVLHFSKLSDVAYRIDTGGDEFHAGGSRLLPPKKYNWDDVTPQLLMNAVGSKPTGEPCRGAVHIPKGSAQDFIHQLDAQYKIHQVPVPAENAPVAEKPAEQQVLDASKLSFADRIRMQKQAMGSS